MTNLIELHVFTNSTNSAPSTKLIENTFKSFCRTFNDSLNVTVWCDIHPNIEASSLYIENLKKIFNIVNETTSLSDGYTKAIKNSSAEFLFMLEHDWIFNNNIKHNLNTILEVMLKDDLMHLRFNKRVNVGKKFDKGIREVNNQKMSYCITPGISNNPHIIQRKKYVDLALPLINVREKSFGIEKELSNSDLLGAIYGPLNYPSTITHVDGKTFRE